MIQLNDDRLLQEYLDRTLSPEELHSFEERLCHEPELAERLITFASDDLVLAEWGADIELEQQTLPDESAVVSRANQFFSRSNRTVGISVLASIFSIFLLLGGYFLYQSVSSSPLVSISEGVVFSSGEPIKNHIRQTLKQGSAELHFPTGAKVLISAPASYEVTGNNSMHLQQGSFIANVPRSGIGFQVDTPHGRVIDLGTLFSVQTVEKIDTRIQVYRGKVIASLMNQAGGIQSSKQVSEHHSATIDSVKNEIAEASDTLSLAEKCGILNYSDSVVLQENMPDALATGMYQVFEHDGLAFIFPERMQVLLNRELMLVAKPSETGPPKRAGTVSAGTKVDCYRIYYDPAVQEGTFIPVQGEIHFDRPILGVILDKKILSQTDRLFHPLSLNNSKREFVHQGTETDTGGNDPQARYDEVSISPDRRTLSFMLLSGERFVDEFRVIVQSSHQESLTELP
ncbi:FecR domain-containing protein [Gimesia sp.]|uniref:FecR domain-containing protein n=1 Tax=Gimesia sp. TaxID=2024833 RepID=UPI003A90558F